jgi:hypothetical protein
VVALRRAVALALLLRMVVQHALVRQARCATQARARLTARGMHGAHAPQNAVVASRPAVALTLPLPMVVQSAVVPPLKRATLKAALSTANGVCGASAV